MKHREYAIHRCLRLAVMICTFLPLVSKGQLGTGSIFGVVRDPSAAVVPGAVVTATKLDTGVQTTTTTTKEGDYSFPFLSVGTYSLAVQAAGFQRQVKVNMYVIVGQALSLDFVLAVGSNTQVVAVTAALPLVDTTSSTSGTNLTLNEAADLPVQLNGRNRNPTDLLQAFPGVNFIASTNNNTSVINGIGDGGGYNSFTSYRIDGIDGSYQPTQSFSDSGSLSPDVVEQLRVVTDTDAESAGDMGSSFVMVTKSGTNQYHGSLYEYVRNDAFDSKNFFATSVSPYKQNEFAGMIGGPIIRDKHFFLVSLGGFIVRKAASGVIASVPTEKMRTGDFSELLGTGVGTIYDPDTNTETPNGIVRQPFPGNIIPQQRISPVSNYFLQGYPLPNLPGLQNNWEGTAVPNNLSKINMYVKTDHNFGEHHHLSFGWEYVPYWSTGGCVSIFANALVGWGPQTLGCSTETVHSYRLRFNYTWAVSDSLLLSARVGVNSDPTTLGSNTGRSNGGQQAGLQGFFEPGIPQVTITDTQGFGITQRQEISGGRVIPMYIDVTKVKGNHQIKVGFQGAVIHDPNEQQYEAAVGFDQLTTGQPGLPNTGWGFASFLLGDVDSVSDTSQVNLHYTMSTWGLFAQDQWRVTPKLTINYGLRYDLFLSPQEESGQTSFFDPTIPNAGAGGNLGALSFWGHGPGRNGRSRILDTDTLVFSPRIGLAYAWKPQIVTRAYYGIDRNPLHYIYYGGTGAPPYGFSVLVSASTLDNGVTPVYNWTNPFPYPSPNLPDLDPTIENGQSVAYTDPTKDRPAMAQAIGLGNEISIGKGVVVGLGYVGKLVHGLPTSSMVDLNQLNPKYYSLGPLLLEPITSSAAIQAGISAPYPGFTGSVAQALRPFPQYNYIDYTDSKSRSEIYHALNISVQKYFGNGFNFLAAYTISKYLTNDQGGGCVHYLCVGPPNAIQVTGQKAWGPSAVDVPQNFTISYVYELPFGRGKRFLNDANSFVRALAGGWEVSGIQSYVSGMPVLVTTSSAIPTVGAVWADVVPGVKEKFTSCGSYSPYNGSRYLNIDAFTAPPPYTLGTTNYLPKVRGCPAINENLSVTKSIPIRESWNLKFGGEFFNAFNRHEWAGLATNVNNPLTFGTFSAATNPRTIQLYGRITF
jgi:hypothetical protein